LEVKAIQFRRPTAYGKGRQVLPTARVRLQEILANFGGTSPDLLIEALHLIQDSEHCLPENLLAACAERFKLSQAEVFEVATFYHHFDVVKNGENRPPSVTVRVCDSLSCEMAGAESVIASLTSLYGAHSGAWLQSGVRVQRVPCIGRCAQAPAAAVGKVSVQFDPNFSKEQFSARINTAIAQALDTSEQALLSLPPFENLSVYRARGGYQTLENALKSDSAQFLSSAASALKTAGLRGLGGAGFSAGNKWEIVGAQPGSKLLVVNADEGEVGTFKDRHYLETHPHQFLEGMLIAAFAVGARHCYIYVRDEYPEIAQILAMEIAALAANVASGYTLPVIELRRGAGAYVCGEESALIESIEGKRGMPRLRPPYVAEVGLFGQPTLVHNVETLYWATAILTEPMIAMRSYSVSGRVVNPGVKLAPAGISVRQLIDDYCGGMLPGHHLYAYLPGGASGGILPARLDYLELDFDKLQPYGCFIGSAAVIVLSQKDSAKQAALNMMKFFKHESCGQCTPCRVGTSKAVALMSEPRWDTELATDLAKVMTDASICGLGQAAPNPMMCVIKYFPQELGL
jgi:formate dehydrogenase beta subunit